MLPEKTKNERKWLILISDFQSFSYIEMSYSQVKKYRHVAPLTQNILVLLCIVIKSKKKERQMMREIVSLNFWFLELFYIKTLSEVKFTAMYL